MHTINDIAEKFGCTVDGNGATEITGVAGLREAETNDLSFLSNKKYTSLAENTRAAVVLVENDFEGSCSAALLRCENPDAVFAKVAMIFARLEPKAEPGIHPSAVIASDATIGSDVTIGPQCVVESGAVIGDRTVLKAQVFIGFEAQIGTDCMLYPNVSVREFCEVGNRVLIHNGTVIGSEGFGYTVDEKGHRIKIPQTGIATIGDDAEIGANVAIDRARFGKTRIGNHVKIDNLVQVAHNVVVGEDAVLVAQVGIAGSSIIGKKAILAGQVGVNGHVKIGDGCVVAGQAGVTKDLPNGGYYWGYPAEPFERASKARAYVGQIPRLKKRIAELEERLRKIENA